MSSLCVCSKLVGFAALSECVWIVLQIGAIYMVMEWFNSVMLQVYGFSWAALAVLIILFKVWLLTLNLKDASTSDLWVLLSSTPNTGVHLQPESFCQLSVAVALYPRLHLSDGVDWIGCGCCHNLFVSSRYIRLHLSISSHWLGNSFSEFLCFIGIIAFRFPSELLILLP